jgi:hypothetical protein
MKRRADSGRSIISGVQRNTRDDLPDYVAERAARDQGYTAVVAAEVERQALRHRLADSVRRLGSPGRCAPLRWEPRKGTCEWRVSDRRR